MNRVRLLFCIALAAPALAGAAPAWFAASIAVAESEPGAVAAAGRRGAVVFALSAALPAESIFPASVRRPLCARIAFWPVAATERRTGDAHVLDATGRTIEQVVAIQDAGEHLAAIIIEDATGRPVSESTPTKFRFSQ